MLDPCFIWFLDVFILSRTMVHFIHDRNYKFN